MDIRVDYYLPMGTARTISHHIYIKVRCHTDNRIPMGCPYSINSLDGNCVRLENWGPQQVEGPSAQITIFDFFKSWGENGCGPT